MRVRIDDSRCEGHGRCYALAPDLFAPDQFGNARARSTGEVSPELTNAALLAAANCPERAVITDE